MHKDDVIHVIHHTKDRQGSSVCTLNQTSKLKVLQFRSLVQLGRAKKNMNESAAAGDSGPCYASTGSSVHGLPCLKAGATASYCNPSE